MVSEWMENGNINQFIEKDRDVNRVDLVRYRPTPYRVCVTDAR